MDSRESSYCYAGTWKQPVYMNLQQIKKPISASALFLFFLVSLGISKLIGGIIGDTFGLLSAILLVLWIAKLLSNLRPKKNI